MPANTDPRVEDSAASWLALIDAGDGRESWERSGAAFRSAVTADAWAEQLRAARGPLGPLTSRNLAVEQQLNGLPGAPQGDYVVRQYHSVYRSLKAVVETLTLVRETDGEWRVVGYFIR